MAIKAGTSVTSDDCSHLIDAGKRQDLRSSNETKRPEMKNTSRYKHNKDFDGWDIRIGTDNPSTSTLIRTSTWT
jgi:hypothetical protein